MSHTSRFVHGFSLCDSGSDSSSWLLSSGSCASHYYSLHQERALPPLTKIPRTIEIRVVVVVLMSFEC